MAQTAAVWVEIPVQDIERARRFYQAVFEFEAPEPYDDGERITATLNGGTENGGPGISLNQTANFHPSDKGPLIYLQNGDSILPALDRVEAAGGTIVTGRTSMGDAGFFALIRDTEGNVLALYDAKFE